MSYWITRPLDDAKRLSELMQVEGLTPFVSPLLNVDYPCPDLGLVPAHIGGLIVTSRNGLRGAAETSFSPEWLDLPLFTVGEGSADLARRFGFRDIRVGAGRASSLPDVIASADLETGVPLVHLCGDVQAFDLKAALSKQGVEVCGLQTYRIVEATRLTDKLINELKAGGITAVVLMSPRTARLYHRLMVEAELGDIMRGLRHFCLSDAVGAALATAYRERVVSETVIDETDVEVAENQETLTISIARQPTLESVIEAMLASER